MKVHCSRSRLCFRRRRPEEKEVGSQRLSQTEILQLERTLSDEEDEDLLESAVMNRSQEFVEKDLDSLLTRVEDDDVCPGCPSLSHESEEDDLGSSLAQVSVELLGVGSRKWTRRAGGS
jgi:hypothetical protein